MERRICGCSSRSHLRLTRYTKAQRNLACAVTGQSATSVYHLIGFSGLHSFVRLEIGIRVHALNIDLTESLERLGEI